MAKRDFLVSIDLNQNQLLQAVLENVAVLPLVGDSVAGQLVYLTTNNRPYYFDGTAWVDFYGGIEKVTAGKGLVLDASTPLGTEAEIIIHAEVDDASLYIDPDDNSGVIKVKPGGITSTHLASNAVTTVKIQDNAVTFAKMQDIGSMTVIGNVTGATASPAEVSIITTINDGDDTVIPTEGAVFRYVNEQITALGTLVGNWDASGGNFPTVGSGAAGAVVSGDYWYITVAGTMGSGTVVNVGDVLYARQDTPGQTDANWFVVESNRDQATETVMGVAMIATTAEALAGTNDTDIITPLKLQAKLVNWYQGTGGPSCKEFEITGDGVTTTFTCTHNWTNQYVNTAVIDKDTEEQVEPGIKPDTGAAVKILFNVAPANGKQYLVVVVGQDKQLS